ncbi:MAG: type II methionyl aminopeptidase [Nanoarchaeota archaeon]|nr:type II methionyl aminopeptidase [Nanoarchaeota archaeon]
MEKKEIETLQEAGKIASEIVKYAKSIIKKDMLLLDIANKIDEKIISLKAKPAFPVNLSINEIAAHSTPSYNDETLAQGLLKVDIGIHIEGFVADTALSIDLENSEENKNLIKAAETARDFALSKINLNTKIREIGAEIEKVCKSFNVQPIHNLSGHSIEVYNLHAGITIPNFDNNQESTIKPGIYAIEPFTTLSSGSGSVRDGKLSGIYHLEKVGTVRDNFAREVLGYIADEYSTLPFCSRWIHKKFGTRGLLALRQIEQAGLLHHYPQLIEKSNSKVAQAEHTFILTLKEKIITTL